MAGLSGLAGRISEMAEMIQFKHTVFALPFALISLITATSPGWPELRTWLWVILAMVAARTAAMSYNRFADHTIDAANPRTASRALPAGRLGRGFVASVIVVSCVVFIVAAANLTRLCLLLSGPTLIVLLGYSHAKRFTAMSHLWLGLALGIAPIGAWIAATGQLSWVPVILGAGVTTWVGGFDIIYSLQDEEFDRRHQLFSLPARLGAGPALALSRLLHLLAVLAFFAFAALAGGGVIRFTAVGLAAALMVKQHLMVSADNLERVDAAFFSVNGILAVLMLACFTFAKLLAGS